MTTTNNTDQTPDQDVLDRVKKLLALTVNPNPNEAAAAAAKAQEILEKYNLTMAEVGNWTDQEDIKVGVVHETIQFHTKNFPLRQWKEDLADTVARYNQVEILTLGRTHLVFVGESTNVQVVISLYQWLVSQLEIAAIPGWREYRDMCKETGTHREDPLVFRNSFFSGAVSEIQHRFVTRRREQSETMQAIVKVHDQAIWDYIGETFTLGKGKSRGSKAGGFSPEGFSQGREVGRKVDLGDTGRVNSGTNGALT